VYAQSSEMSRQNYAKAADYVCGNATGFHTHKEHSDGRIGNCNEVRLAKGKRSAWRNACCAGNFPSFHLTGTDQILSAGGTTNRRL